MADRLRQVQPAIGYAAAFRDADLRLEELARKAGLSPSRFHRLFSEIAGEAPRKFTERLRLERAAALLVAAHAPVLEIALDCGFQSHEVFARAFRRRYGLTPSAYRKRGVTGASAEHARLVDKIGPCVSLYRWSEKPPNLMNYTVTKMHLDAQPILSATRSVRRSAISATIIEVLPHIFQFAQQHGIGLNGHPLTRYREMSAGTVTMEPAIRVVSGAGSIPANDPDVVLETLPAGPTAVTTHMGPYDQLQDAYAAIEEWMKANGETPGGAPWESYVTDPGETPNPADWKTEVFWPLQK